MANEFLDPAFVARLTTILVGAGMAISTLEFIANIGQCREAGLFSWEVWREAKLGKRPLVKKLTNPLFSFVGVLAVLVVRFLLLALLLYWLLQGRRLSSGLLSALVVTQLYLNFRYPVGKDGSDQMSTIVLVMLTLISWFPTSRLITNASIVFIAYQAVVSYLTAGIAKLISPQWRSGDVVLEVLNTETYGSRFMAFVLREHSWARRALNYGTMVFESSIFLVFLLPYPYNALFLIVPLSFHVGCALFMGLNSFLFAFVATFPSILYVSNQIHRIADMMERYF